MLGFEKAKEDDWNINRSLAKLSAARKKRHIRNLGKLRQDA